MDNDSGAPKSLAIEISELKKQRDLYNQRIEQLLEQELYIKKDKINFLIVKNKQLRQSLEQKSAAQNVYRKEISKLTDAVNKLKSSKQQITKLKEQIDSQDQYILELKKSIENQQEQIKQLKNQKTQSISIIANPNENEALWVTENMRLTQIIKKQTQERDTINEEFKSLKLNAKKASQWQMKYDKLNKQFKDLQATIKSTQNSLKNAGFYIIEDKQGATLVHTENLIQKIKAENDQPVVQSQKLDSKEFAKNQITYFLDILNMENFGQIQSVLRQFLFNEKEICQMMIDQIIERASKIADCKPYAFLCGQFLKINRKKFIFMQGQNNEQIPMNFFWMYLIQKVKLSFDSFLMGSTIELQQIKSTCQKSRKLKSPKLKLFGTVNFMAELVRFKALSDQIVKITFSNLLSSFLAKYYYWSKTKIIDYYFYMDYFEALIVFVDNLGQLFEQNDNPINMDNQKSTIRSKNYYELAFRKIFNIIEMKQEPSGKGIEEIGHLSALDCFRLLAIVDDRILKKQNVNLSRQLLNLTQRRANNWQTNSKKECSKIETQISDDIKKEEE